MRPIAIGGNMPAHLPRLNKRVLAVFLVVGLPILALGIGVVLALGQARLTESYGRHLAQVAQQTAASIDAYVYRRLLDVSLIARTPDLRVEALASSSRPFAQDDAEALDRVWQQRGARPDALAVLLQTKVSKYLADIVAHDRIYRELLLTDRFGRLVAASGPSTDYFQGDEDWWKATVEGSGQAMVTDVRWDESARVHAIEIAVPVPEPDSDVLAGVLKVVTDSREMLAAVGGVQFGASGQAVLLRENGSIVFSRRTSDPSARFFASEEIQKQAPALLAGGPESGAFFKAPSPEGDVQLVGLAASQLGRTYQHLSWVVAVTQSEREALAPVEAIGLYLLIVFVLTVAVVLLLALWFSVRLEAPAVEEDMRLVEHPPVSHVGDVDETPLPPGPEARRVS
jgi:hypothetical protein